MRSFVSHVQVNIDMKNRPFYKEFLTILGWNELYADETVSGFSSGGETEASMWFLEAPEDTEDNSDTKGVSHVGISVENMKQVDEIASWLKEKNIETLYGTPKERPEFSFQEGHTYYQVMFKSPDNVLLEIMYSGEK